MKIITCKNYSELSKVAANIVVAKIGEKSNCVLGLPTGSTPIGMYKELVNMHKHGKVNFEKVITFNLDEYYPISHNNEQSYYYFMHHNLFKCLDINPQNIHIPNGETDNPLEECLRYEQAIESAGGIDLQVLGMGQNGHIGFNEPADYLSDVTNILTLTQNTLITNSRFFNSIEEMPKQAITMGLRAIIGAKEILLLVSGEDKREILQRFLEEQISTHLPVSMLKLHYNTTLVTDIEI